MKIISSNLKFNAQNVCVVAKESIVLKLALLKDPTNKQENNDNSKSKQTNKQTWVSCFCKVQDQSKTLHHLKQGQLLKDSLNGV